MMKAAGYIRVSTTGQALTGESLAVQREAIAQYCGAYNMELVEVYEDAGFSGANGHRPAFNRMILDAIGGMFTTIVVYDIMRAGRDLRDFLDVVARLDEHGVTMVCIRERIDTADTGTGRLILNVLASVAQWEHAKIKERMDAGKNARRHHKHGPQIFIGTAPFGYRWDKEKAAFYIVDAEADVYRAAVAAYMDEGLSIKAVASRLRDAGVLNRKKPHSATTIGRMLRNPAYTGQIIGNRYVYKKEGQYTKCTGKEKPRAEWVFYNVPALIERPRWEAMQTRLDAAGARTKTAGNTTEDFWLRDVLKCGLCGHVVKPKIIRNGPKNGNKIYKYYACSCKNASGHTLAEWGVPRCTLPNVPQTAIETRIWRRILQIYTFTEAGRAANIGPAIDAGRWDERLVELNGRITKHKRALAGKRAAADNLYTMLENPDLTEDDLAEFAARAARAREEQNTIAGHLAAAEAELAALETAKNNDTLYRDFLTNERGTLKTLARQLGLLEPADRKMLVDAMLAGEHLNIVADADGWAVTGLDKLTVNMGAVRALVAAGKLGALAAHYHAKNVGGNHRGQAGNGQTMLDIYGTAAMLMAA